MKRLEAYLEIVGFEALKGIKGYAYYGEELSIEVLFVGRKYIVRAEVACRYEAPALYWHELSKADDVINLVAEHYGIE